MNNIFVISPPQRLTRRELCQLVESVFEDGSVYFVEASHRDELRNALQRLRQQQDAAAVPATATAAQKEGSVKALTATEKEVLKHIALGRSVKEIADTRHSSTHTIITHKKNIFRKLDVSNVHEATKYALRAGLVDLVEYYI